MTGAKRVTALPERTRAAVDALPSLTPDQRARLAAALRGVTTRGPR